MTIPSRRLSRASALLRDALAVHPGGSDAFVAALGVDVERIDAFVTGRDQMPLDKQLRLALFVIGTIPTLARMGHRLQAQVAAATDFHQGRTATHSAGPPRS